VRDESESSGEMQGKTDVEEAEKQVV